MDLEKYKIVDGNLIDLALSGNFRVITHGCNCFCTMKSGIAVPMSETFGCDKFPMESNKFKGNINKLGTIDYQKIPIMDNERNLYVVNSYTQFNFKTDENPNPVDYLAIALCLKKINHIFKGLSIGIPKIGCGLAGGNWNTVEKIVQESLKDCFVTVVNFK